MEISEGLQKLIDASLADGKISKKEKDVLAKRAVKEGLDQDEFDLYLDSILHQKKSERESFFNKIVYHREDGYHKVEVDPGVGDILKGALTGGVKKKYEDVYKKGIAIRLWHVVAPVFLVVIIILGILIMPKSETVDDALSTYNFQKAREIAANMACRDDGNSWDGKLGCPRSLNLLKIIIQEANYMADQNEFDKAFSAIEEISSIEFYGKLYNKSMIEKNQATQKDELYSLVLSKGIMQKALTKKQVEIYLVKVKSNSIKKEIRNLLN